MDTIKDLMPVLFVILLSLSLFVSVQVGIHIWLACLRKKHLKDYTKAKNDATINNNRKRNSNYM